MGRDVRQLKVWQRGMDLCEAVYAATAAFPADERFGLTAQMRRAAVSIPSSLAEGYARGSRKEYRQFAFVARGSASELETQVTVAERLRLLPQEHSERLTAHTREVLRMLSALAAALGR
jgi:four helix bundle protein